MGVAGSGKSVQGRWLADELALPWLSTGEFLRMLISGQRRKAMLAGQLLGDQEIIALVQKILSLIDNQQEFILDGFPRTTGQADWLLNQVKHGQFSISYVIHLTASEEVVRNRLIDRGRQDDHEAAIDERFREYQQTILPIIDQFRAAGMKIIDIDSQASLESVHQQITAVIPKNNI